MAAIMTLFALAALGTRHVAERNRGPVLLLLKQQCVQLAAGRYVSSKVTVR